MQNQGSQQGQQSQQQYQQTSQRQYWQNRSVVTIEAIAPSPDTFVQLAQQLQSQPGLKEVSLRREGPTPRIRISATPEALQTIQQVVQQIVQSVQESVQSSSF